MTDIVRDAQEPMSMPADEEQLVTNQGVNPPAAQEPAQAAPDATPRDLLPCPFCGGDSHPSTVRYSSVTIKEQNWGQDTFHHVTCAHCGSSNRGLVGYRTPELAAEHWNRRARPPLAAPPAAPCDCAEPLPATADWTARNFCRRCGKTLRTDAPPPALLPWGQGTEPPAAPRSEAVSEVVSTYVADYDFRGDDADHTPTEGERILIEDAIQGLLVDPDFLAAWRTEPRGDAQEALPEPVGFVSDPSGTFAYRHFVRTREPRPDEVGAKLYALHDAQAEPQEGDLLHTMMEWARTEEGRKQLADSYRPHLWACAKRVADPQNEAATCRHWCGDIEHCQPIASAPAQPEPRTIPAHVQPATLSPPTDWDDAQARDIAARDEQIQRWRDITARNDPDDCAAGIAELYGKWQAVLTEAATLTDEHDKLVAKLADTTERLRAELAEARGLNAKLVQSEIRYSQELDKAEFARDAAQAAPDDLQAAIAAGNGTLHGAIDHWQNECARLRAERDDWKRLAENWTACADAGRQPDEFYEKYNEGTMRAIQAMLFRAEAERDAALAAIVAYLPFLPPVNAKMSMVGSMAQLDAAKAMRDAARSA